MFSNLSKPSSSFDEGIVTQVDIQRKVCKVKTVSGQNLGNVLWTETVGGVDRIGDRIGPSMGDVVLLAYGLGHPVIIGFLTKPQGVDNTFPLTLYGSGEILDTGNFSSGGNLARPDRNKVPELLNGDRVLSSNGGAMLALLRSGSALLKSSALAQVFTSKLGHLVRIVSRNWEHFTDVSTDVVKNFKGRVYRYVGYTNAWLDSKVSLYKYHLLYGDVVAGEVVLDKYKSYSGTPAAKSDVIFKEKITEGEGEDAAILRMFRTLTETGKEEVYIVAGSGGDFTRRVSDSGELTLSYKDLNTVTINNDVIKLQRSDGAVITMTSAGIKCEYSGGVIEMQSAGITSSYSGGVVDMHSGGVDTTFGGHFVKVSAGGVQLG